MKKTLSIMLLCLIALNTFAQINTKIDSLKLELKKNKADKFLDYKNITLFYINSNDVENTKKYSKITLDYALAKKNDSYIASAKIVDSRYYALILDYDTASKIADEALVYAQKSKDIKVQSFAYYNLAIICESKGDFKNTIRNCNQAINLIDGINTNREFDQQLATYHLENSYSYSNLGILDLAKKEIINAKKYPNLKVQTLISLFDAEIQLYENMKDIKGAINEVNKMMLFLKKNDYLGKERGLIDCYFNLAEFNNRLEDYNNSNHYLNLVLNFGKEKINFITPQLFNLKSKNKLAKGLNQEALINSDSATYYSKFNSDLKQLAISYGIKGNILSKLKKHQEAIVVYKIATKILRKNDSKIENSEVLNGLINAYLATHQNQKASQTLKEFIALKDTIYNEQVAKSMTAAEVRYGTEVKEAQIKTQQLQIEQEKTNKFMAFGGIGFLVLLSGGGYYLSRNKQKTVALQTQNTLLSLQQNLNTMELQSLNKQLDPHEIKNLLASISPEIQDKAPEAYKNMLKLLNLTKASLNNSSITESIERQVQQIDDFMVLEKNMLSEPLTFSIENNIKNQQTQIPRFLLKNLVENSIKHGIKGNENGGEIKVKLSENQHFIFMEVDDTGKGRKHAISQDSGIGTTTYQKLFATLNQRNPESATFEIIDKEQGTKVEVKIPTDYKFVF